ncbi:MAG TPA: PadR family transcriptional regulator [Thermomicrobiales bacterium]|nr:PadR family transcriptional regulator [Thermomicrobiales bacterium]
MLRDFFLGFVKVHILHHAAEAPVYGAALMAELRRHGYDLSPGTLYPLLHSLEREGLLVREARVVSGKVRKYYTATDEGHLALAEAREKIGELVREVLAGEGPAALPGPAAGPDEDPGR